MEKNVLGKGQYATTGIMFIRGEFKPGETIRAQALEGNNVISCRECLFRQKEFKKICQSMRCVDMSTGKCQTYKQVKL